MRGRPVTFADGRGGANLRDSPYLLADNEARDARNVVGTVRGARRKRDGHIGFSTPANALTSLYASENPLFLLGAGGTKLFKIDPAGVDTDITGALTLVNDALFEWVNAPANGGQGPLYGVNGDEAVHWTGAGNAGTWTAASGTLPANAKYLEYAGLRVWAAGMSSYGALADPGSYVVASDLGNPRAWPAEMVFGFDPGDGEAITALGRVGPYVFVAKPSKCWVITDPEGTGANRPLAENIGCVAHRSLAETDSGLYFLTRDQGPFWTNGSTVRRLDDRLQPMFDQLVHANRHLAAAVAFGGHYYLSISQSGGVNTILLDYDLALESWWIHSTPAAQLCVWEPAGAPQLHAAVPGVARTDRLFVPGRFVDANDAVYASYWLGAHHAFGAPHRRKRFREVRFDGKGRMEVLVALDFAAAPILQGSADFTGSDGSWEDASGLWEADDGGLWGGTAEVGEQGVLNLGVGRTISVQFGNATVDPWEVEAYSVLLGDRKD